MKTLELKDIAAYLPYGLKVCHDKHIGPDTLFEMWFHPIKADERIVCGVNSILELSEIKPILRPMSDLTKEIIHRGEKFVPMVKLASILRPGFQWKLNEKGTGCVDAESPRHTFWFDGNSFFTFVFIPPYSKQLERVVIEPCDQIIGFDKLAEWKLDYRGLIPGGLALDLNTLDRNPYGTERHD